ncbi:MAG: sulfotransferase domain-containing protein [Myxococcota bacterium]
MVPCTWLATYPKSGTTWTRFLIHELLVGPAARSSDLDAVIPSIHANHQDWKRHLERGGILCTHKEHGRHTEKYGTEMHGFIHVVRHPADVLLSEARFFCLMQAGDVERREGSVDAARLDGLFADYLTVMMHGGQTEKHRRVGMGTWGEHTASWLAARAHYPHVVIRYEDLTQDPVHELRRIAVFLGLERSNDELGSIVERCSADALRRMQELEIARRETGRFYHGDEFKPAYDLGLRFVGKAMVGEGKQLGVQALERLEELFGEAMTRAGYTADPDDPVVAAARLRGLIPLPDVAAEALHATTTGLATPKAVAS